MSNADILRHTFRTPHEAFPFDVVTDKDYEPAITALLQEAKADLERIAKDPEPATFASTIAALDYNGKQMARVVEAFFNVNSAETNDYLQELAQKVAPQLAAFSNDILLNKDLFYKVKAVCDKKDQLHLDGEASRLLSITYKNFVRNGALLSEQKQSELRNLDQQLSTLKVQFSQHVLQETNGYQLHLLDETDIAGLPESILRQASEISREQGKSGYIFTLQFPSYVPFMKYAANRERRKELYLAYNRRAFQQNECNNEQVIRDIVALKDQRAQLLGYENHAAFVLEERMAKSEETVRSFLRDLLTKARPQALREIDALRSLAARDGIETLMPYDHAYYAEKLREAQYDYSEEMLKAYFPLEQVLNAAFGLAEKLFGLRFSLRNDIPVYHPEVRVYEVQESRRYKALLYTDFHPRPGKRSGAWMTSFKGQYIDHQGNNSRPHISIVCNFSRPVANTPSLLTFSEVTTLFHEFGHALHGMLADTHFESLSGTNVFWDFVELPSQFLENYCYEKSFLNTFAHHWESGEALDDNTIDKIVKAANFMEGYQTLRQVSFGLLDMAYYHGSLPADTTISTFEQQQILPAQLYPLVPDTAFSPSFSHIFGGGYDAGYYSYKWAEVLDADAFAYFKEQGIFNPDTAAQYKTLLSKGGTVDPIELYIQFRGREPDVSALLKRAGLE